MHSEKSINSFEMEKHVIFYGIIIFLNNLLIIFRHYYYYVKYMFLKSLIWMIILRFLLYREVMKSVSFQTFGWESIFLKYLVSIRYHVS